MLRSTCLGAFFMFMLRSTCFHAFFHVCAQIYMSMCFLLCLCIDVHVYVLFSMFMLRCSCLRTFFHVCTYIYMSMCFFPFPCAPCHVWIKSTYWMLCLVLLQPFCLFLRIFLVFWPLGRVQIQILWSKPTSKGLDHFLLCMCMIACFYALQPYFFGQIQVLSMLCALYGLVLVGLWGHLILWLHPSLLWLVQV